MRSRFGKDELHYITGFAYLIQVRRTQEKPVGLLAKVGVEGSNPFARSSFSKQNQYLTAQAEIDFLITRLKFGPA